MAAVLDAVLPPQVKLVARLMLLFVCFGGLVELDLLRLGVGHLIFKISANLGDIHCNFLNIAD